MKCLVCGRLYEAAECPRCSFPNIHIMEKGAEDRKKAMQKLMPVINEYRTNFLESVNIELVVYRWKDQDGQIVLDREDRICFGTGKELLQEEKWLKEKFARIPDEKEVSVTVRITIGSDDCVKNISIPNLQKPELQQIGAKVDSSFALQLLLRNDTETPTNSETVPLFA